MTLTRRTLPFRVSSPLLAALLLALFAAGCDRPGPEGRPSPATSAGVFVAETTGTPKAHVFTGTVEGIRRVSLGTKLMGRITSLPFDIGTPVRAGQLVVRINAGDVSAKQAQATAGADEAESAYANAERQYTRVKNLFAQESASRKEMDDAEMMFRMAAARVAGAREMRREVDNMLEYSDLRSPIDGSVVARFAQEGDLASPGLPLVVIEDTHDLVVDARVPESEVAAVTEGDPVTVTLDAVARAINGTVTQVNAAGDPASRQFHIKVRLARTPGIRSGMNARVTLRKGMTQAITVPDRALVRRGELEGLFLLAENGTAVLRWVRTGMRDRGTTEILAGLRPGERVLVDSVQPLHDGQPVQVTP